MKAWYRKMRNWGPQSQEITRTKRCKESSVGPKKPDQRGLLEKSARSVEIKHEACRKQESMQKCRPNNSESRLDYISCPPMLFSSVSLATCFTKLPTPIADTGYRTWCRRNVIPSTESAIILLTSSLQLDKYNKACFLQSRARFYR